jgi:SAM-dependent MidA family methyltransferase
MAGDLRERILERVRHEGPIPFDAFMELALYDGEGYYARPPIGADGDFVTSPHVHWWFAYALALALGELDDALGRPRPVRLVELGAGDGTLARQLTEILASAGPVEYTAVERSAGAHPALERIGLRAVSSLAEVGDIEGASVVANELLDNLPFRRFRRASGGGVVEVRVGAEGERLIEVETPAGDGLPDELDDGAVAGAGAGEEFVVPTGALALVEALAERRRHAYALLIDYSSERGRDVHGYRAQRVVEDVLAEPGSGDVTAGVDFDAVERRARRRGLDVLGRVTQRGALLALGFASWTERDLIGRPRDERAAVEAWAGRSRATLLVDEQGLGAHRWLLLGTPGLPVPRWLDDARER